MAFKTACFISYPHNAGKSVDAFVARLTDELKDRLAQFVTDPVVTDHDFPTGADFNKAIAKAICESACLLVVYMPVYERKAFCIQEYVAMERHQTKRYQSLQRDLSDKFGMILPLVYAGHESKIPKWISQKINYKNISHATIADPVSIFETGDFKRWLVEVANLIDSLYNEFRATENVCAGCEADTLPDEADKEVLSRLNGLCRNKGGRESQGPPSRLIR
jgi:hypothetical protein